MKVKQLIEQLQQYDPELTVYYCSTCGCCADDEEMPDDHISKRECDGKEVVYFSC